MVPISKHKSGEFGRSGNLATTFVVNALELVLTCTVLLLDSKIYTIADY